MGLISGSSIRERLHIALICILVCVFVFFILLGLYLTSINWLNATTLIQLISSCATTLVVFVTLGLRMISDALDKYEKSTTPQIKSLQGLIRQVQGTILRNTSSRILDDYLKILKITSYMTKFQKFFFTKLYPVQSINQLNSLTTNVTELVESLKELLLEWSFQQYQDVYLTAILAEDENEREKVMKDFLSYYQKDGFNVNSFIKRILTEKRDMINTIKRLKKNIHEELDEIEEQLDNFLQAN